jgi:hypothetical protein
MSVLTPAVSETILDRLFRLIEICNRRSHGRRAYVPDRAADATLKLRRLLADAVAEIAKLKRLLRENATAARSLRAELSEAKVESASLELCLNLGDDGLREAAYRGG